MWIFSHRVTGFSSFLQFFFAIHSKSSKISFYFMIIGLVSWRVVSTQEKRISHKHMVTINLWSNQINLCFMCLNECFLKPRKSVFIPFWKYLRKFQSPRVVTLNLSRIRFTWIDWTRHIRACKFVKVGFYREKNLNSYSGKSFLMRQWYTNHLHTTRCFFIKHLLWDYHQLHFACTHNFTRN